MTEHEVSRRVHGLQEESDGDSDSCSDTDSYSSLRPPPYNYEDIKDNIVVIEAKNGELVGNEHLELKKRSRKRKRWLPFSLEVAYQLKQKTSAIHLHTSEKTKDNVNGIMPDSLSSLERIQDKLEREQINEQTDYSAAEKCSNTWGNVLFYQQHQEKLNQNHQENDMCADQKGFCENIRRIWYNDSNVESNEKDPSFSAGALSYIQNVWDSFSYSNSSVQSSSQQNIEKHEFLSYFSDDFEKNNDVRFECLETQDETENVTNCLSEINEIMPEYLLENEILIEFKKFLSNFSNLNKSQQDLFLNSNNFDPVLKANPVALYNLRTFNTTIENCISNFKSSLEKNEFTSKSDIVDLNLSLESTKTSKSIENLSLEKSEVNSLPIKISPSKSTNIVKPYNFNKQEENIEKIQSKKSQKKIVSIKERKFSDKRKLKDNLELKSSAETTELPTNIDNVLLKSEQNSLNESEIAEMEKTLNEIEFDESSSESDTELYEKTTKTVSFVILLSKVMYIVLIIMPYRYLMSFLSYLMTGSYVKKCYVKAIGHHFEFHHKRARKKIKKIYKTYINNFVNIKFFKSLLISLASFHFFSKIEIAQPFLSWIYDFYNVLVFIILPCLFISFEVIFLKPLCWLYDRLFNDTFLKTSSHISKILFFLISTYYIYKVTTLTIRGIRTCLLKPFRMVKRYLRKQYEFLVESLILFQNQTFTTARKERKERDFKTYKMRQIRRRN